MINFTINDKPPTQNEIDFEIARLTRYHKVLILGIVLTIPLIMFLSVLYFETLASFAITYLAENPPSLLELIIFPILIVCNLVCANLYCIIFSANLNDKISEKKNNLKPYRDGNNLIKLTKESATAKEYLLNLEREATRLEYIMFKKKMIHKSL